MFQPLIIVLVFIGVGIVIKALSLKVALFILAVTGIIIVRSWLGGRPEKLQLPE